MLARTALSLVNLGVLSGTLLVWFFLPHYATFALYACLGWVVVAFGVMYSPWGNRAIGPARVASGTTGSGGPRVPLDFCIYCATSLPVGATRCPACGHAAARG